MTIDISPTASDDLDEITRLYVSLEAHHRKLQPHNPRYQVGDEAWRRVAEAALADPRSELLVARSGGRVVGFVGLAYEDKPWGLTCEVKTLVVDEDHRGRGLGTALMRAAEAKAHSSGARGLRVDVLQMNGPARSFYEGLGYEMFAVRYGKPVA